MSQQPTTTEDRLALLESRVNELEQARRDQDTINGALLIRIDNFIGDLHRMERSQRQGFDSQAAQIKDLTAGVVTLVDIAQDHKQAIETLSHRVERIEEGQQALQAGMDQVVAILTGKQRTND